MAVYSENPGISSVIGYTEEVHQLLRANRLESGTPSDFQNLARAFKNDTRLREDLVSLSRSIMERDKTMSLRNILTIIAVASGGPDIALSESDETHPIDLTSFIMHSDVDATDSTENHDRHAIEPTTSLSDYGAQSTQSSDAEYPQTSPLDHYAESLTRLELNSLQMKHYLDSIDQRISRMEPRLDSLPEYVSVRATHQPALAPDAKYSSEIASETLPPPPQNDPLPPKQEAKPKTTPNLQIPSRQPLTPKRYAVTIVPGLATAAVVVAALLYWTFHRDSSSTTIRRVTADLAGATTTAPSNLEPLADGDTSSPPKTTTGAAQQDNPATGKSVTATTDQPLFSKPTPIRLSTSSPSVTAVDHPPTAVAPESSPAAPPTSSSASSAIPERHIDFAMRRINVSSGVMAENVLSAPQPSYPRLASLTHMQGEVVMQAVISKLGKIEDVHVIKGHRLLRSAATNAVRTWRYRPFLVNGRPVEVATIVTVDFRLSR